MLLERPQVTARDFFFQNQNPAPLHALIRSLFFHVFPIFSVSSDIRSSQVISSRLARANFISAHFMWQQMCCAKESPADILCKQQCTPLKFGKLHVCLTHKFTNLRFYDVLRVYAKFCKFTKFTVLRSKAARSDGKFTILPFYGAFLGNNGIYHFMVLPFYSAPGQKTCFSPAPCTQTPQKAFFRSFFLFPLSLSLSFWGKFPSNNVIL